MVVESRLGYDGVRDFDLFLLKAGIGIVPVNMEQAKIPRLAFRQFGKGRHAANLNFGDCFSYVAERKYLCGFQQILTYGFLNA